MFVLRLATNYTVSTQHLQKYISNLENSCSHPVLLSLMAMRILRSLPRYRDYTTAVTIFVF